MTATSGPGASDPDTDTVDIIVAAMLEKFGDRAALVARAQIARAAPETVDIWQEIARHLDHNVPGTS